MTVFNFGPNIIMGFTGILEYVFMTQNLAGQEITLGKEFYGNFIVLK